MNPSCIQATLLANGKWWARGRRHQRWQSCHTWGTEQEALAVAREFVKTGKLPPKKRTGFAAKPKGLAFSDPEGLRIWERRRVTKLNGVRVDLYCVDGLRTRHLATVSPEEAEAVKEWFLSDPDGWRKPEILNRRGCAPANVSRVRGRFARAA